MSVNGMDLTDISHDGAVKILREIKLFAETTLVVQKHAELTALAVRSLLLLKYQGKVGFAIPSVLTIHNIRLSSRTNTSHTESFALYYIKSLVFGFSALAGQFIYDE